MRLGLGLGLVRLGKAIASFVRDGLKLYYPFKDNSPELLLSGATSFDGTNDYIDTGTTFQSTFRDSFSISAWVKFDDGNPSATTGILGNRNSSGQDAIVWSIDTSGKLQFQYKSNNASKYATSNSAVFANGATEWTHCLVSADNSASQITLYVNGVAVALNSSNNGDISSITMADFTIVDNLYLGARNENGTANTFLNGSLANVGIWNRALSASEIESIYWKGQYADLKGTELTNLISWYNLKETNYGSELVTNGDFENGSTGWTLGDFSIVNGQATVTHSDTTDYLIDSETITGLDTSKEYLLSYNSVANNGGAQAGFYLRTSSGGSTTVFYKHTTTGVQNFIFAPTATSHKLRFYSDGAGGNGTTTIDDISLKEIQAPDSTGTNNGSIIGATTLTDAYSASSPFLPRIQDKATPKGAVALASGSTSFDGTDDYINCGNDSSLDITDAITVSAWMLTTVSSDHQRIVAKQFETDNGTANSCFQLAISNSDKFRWAVGGVFDINSSDSIVPNTWNYMVGTYDKTTAKLYVNGQLVQSTSATAVIRTSSQDLTIGTTKFNSSIEHETHGSIANVAIYSDAKTQSQIQDIMFSSYSTLTSALKTNLVSWYDLGTNVEDSHGSNNGTNNGATINTGYTSSPSGVADPLNYGEIYGGNAVSFDGANDYIKSGASNAIITGTNVTYSFWIKSTDTDSAYVLQNQKGAGSTNLGVRINNTTGIINLLAWDGSSHNALNAVTTINDSKWHHVAFTTTASAQVVYIDGKQDATSSNTFNNSASSDLFQIGRLGSGSSFFGGSLSALKVFSEVLTQDQVRELYTKPELTLPTGIASSALKLDMPMQEGSGTAILDGSPTFLDVAVNGDFSADAVGSTSVTGWSLDDFTAEVIADGYTGNAVQLTRSDSGTQSFYQDLSGITSGNEYKINVKLKAIGGSVAAGIRVTTPTNSNPSSNIVSLPADGSWQDVELSFTAQGTTARIQIQRQESDPGSIVVDDVIINQLNLGQNHGTGDGITWATGQEYGFQHPLVRSNNPMVFDGSNDQVDCGSGSALDNIFVSGGTVSGWINPNSAGEGGFGMIVDKRSNSVGWNFTLNDASGGVSDIYFYQYFSGTDAQWQSTNREITLNEWNHVAVTYNSSSTSNDAIIYVNGSAVALTQSSNPTGTASDDSSINLQIGSLAGAFSFDGMINDVAVWDSTLTANEVTALYNSGLPLLPTTDSGNYASADDLMGYWRNDGVTTWIDRTPLSIELNTPNADFTEFDGITGDSFTVSNGILTVTNGSSNSFINYYTTFNPVVGRTYRITVTTSSSSGTGLGLYINNVNSDSYKWNRTFDYTAVDTNPIFLRLFKFGGHNGSGVVTGFSLKVLKGGNNGTVSGDPASIIVPEGLNEGRDSQGYYLTDTDSISSGIRFKDSEKIVIQDSETLDFETNDFSVAFWVYFKDRVINQGIWEKRNDTSNQIRIYTDADGYINGLAKTGGSTRLHAETNSAPSINQWTYVTWVCDRNSSNFIYVNGVAQTLANNTKDDGANDMAFGEMTIGRAESSAQYLNGYLDEFKIYKSKVLSATEVLKNYNNGKSAHSN